MTTPSQGRKSRVDRFGARLRARGATLSPRLKVVADYINENRRAVLGQSALEIAAETGTSDATVIRAVQALGFDGLRDLKRTLAGFLGEVISSVDKMSATTEELTRDVDASIDFVRAGHLAGIEQVTKPENRRAIAAAIELMRGGAGIGLFGIGASAIIADYAARLLVRNGRHAYALNRTGIALGEQLLAMRRGDVLVMMGQASAHREGAATLEEARRLDVPMILLTGSASPAFGRQARVVIHVPRGKSETVPLHGLVLMCIEMLVFGLAATEPERSVRSLERLHTLYEDIRKPPRGV
ncbi:MurR/RpiR family transcriptional regulator [Xanthobacter dioxanivorans]|uniref:MurR/RpiR family transcriptional regulator n=1 Tax=Xanthobacter dioxanivorans TaxID=2528964 RepID=A0A974PMU5_9HYPH|nr:MurR/RpiR family transcriptional regulator [Xanthobacter dioxanivorans]QRG06216.1 MurR/RpiR family transcriptional regulator [Xanthobacter dioxanivorans]